MSDRHETAYEKHQRELDRQLQFEATVSILVMALVVALAWLVS